MVLILIFIIIVSFLLGCVSSVKISETRLSRFEIERRSSRGDEAVIRTKRQLRAYPGLQGVRLKLVVLLFILDLLLGNLFGGPVALVILGLICMTVELVFIRSGRVSRLTAGLNRRWRTKYEPRLAGWFLDHPKVLRLYGPPKRRPDLVASSTEELSHMLETTTLIDPQTKQILGGVTDTAGTSVFDVMVPLDRIESVQSSELLGPLVVDELHKKGIRYYPVLDDDTKRFVGILDIGALTSLSVRSTPLARSAMNKGIETIEESVGLIEAIDLFLRSGSPLFIVVSEQDEPLGMITVADAIRAFTGGVLPSSGNNTIKGDADDSDTA